MTVLEQFNITDDVMKDQASIPLLPDVVAGRVLQLDADFTCYEASYDDSMTFDVVVSNFKAIVEKHRILAGAESVMCHMTAGGSDKGGRYDAAIQKVYQDNRKDKVKPINLEPLRVWVRDNTWENVKSSYSTRLEADDTMCIAQQVYLDADERHLSIIASGDKDLTMMSGLHLDVKTWEIVDVHGFGSCYLDESGSSKKVKGWGTSFFWHQMLMGDVADNIQGLKQIEVEALNQWFPTKAVLAAGDNQVKLAKIKRKPQPCGAVKAYELLKDCTNDMQAKTRVQYLYNLTYGSDWLKIFDSEAHLLWMRRYDIPDDHIKFMEKI